MDPKSGRILDMNNVIVRPRRNKAKEVPAEREHNWVRERDCRYLRLWKGGPPCDDPSQPITIDGIEWPRYPHRDPKLLCGVKKRNGERCMMQAVSERPDGRPPNGRCKFHGGLGGAPPKNLVKTEQVRHGIYKKGLHPHEKDDFDHISLGNLDEELRMARIKLARAYRAQAIYEKIHGLDDSEQVSEYIEHSNMFTEGDDIDYVIENMSEKTYLGFAARAEDFSEEILKFTKIIGTLETKRADLLDRDNATGALMMSIKKKLGNVEGDIDEEVLALAVILKGMRKNDVERLKTMMIGQ